MTVTDFAPLEAVLERFLASLADPAGGEALYALYAADAPLLWRAPEAPEARRASPAWLEYQALAADPAAALRRLRAGTGAMHRLEVRAKRELTAEAFALGHRAAAEAGGPRWTLVPGGAPLAAREEGEGVLVWVEVAEAQGERAALAAGLRREAGEGWRLEWATLCPAVEPGWTYALGRAQMLADFPVAYTGRLEAPRAWIDLAHHRHFGLARPALLPLPEARFACHGSGDCCHANFEIVVPEPAQAFLDALPWETVRPELRGVELPLRADGQRLLKPTQTPCPLLDAERRCSLHRLLGRPVFAACTTYPVQFAETPDGLAVTTSAACPSARAQLGPSLTERTEDLYGRLALTRPFRTDDYRLAEGASVPWARFARAEGALLGLLARKDVPLARRLWAATRWLEEDLEGWETSEESYLGEPLPVGAPALVASVDELLQGLLAPWPPLLDALPLGERVRHADLRGEAVLARVLRELLHGKEWSYRFNLATALNVGVLLYVLTLVRQAESLPAEDAAHWAELGKLIAHRGAFLAAIERDGALRRAIGQPAYGQWLLGYAR